MVRKSNLFVVVVLFFYFLTKSPWNQCFKDTSLVNDSKSFAPQEGQVGQVQETGSERLAGPDGSLGG